MGPDEGLEFGEVVEAGEIGVVGDPVEIGEAGGVGLFDHFEGFSFFAHDAVSAGGIVKSVGIAGAEGDGGLKMADGFVDVLFFIGLRQVASEENASADILGDQFELLT